MFEVIIYGKRKAACLPLLQELKNSRKGLSVQQGRDSQASPMFGLQATVDVRPRYKGKEAVQP